MSLLSFVLTVAREAEEAVVSYRSTLGEFWQLAARALCEGLFVFLGVLAALVCLHLFLFWRHSR